MSVADWPPGPQQVRRIGPYSGPYGRVEHRVIRLLELNKFAAEQVETEQARWLRVFKDGDRLDDAALPPWMQTDEMRQAMSRLKGFSEKERDYHAYQPRRNRSDPPTPTLPHEGGGG